MIVEVDAAEVMTQPTDLFGLPPLDAELLAQLTPLTEEELGAKFDELTEIAASQPDDKLALSSLRHIVAEAQTRGEITLVMQMAATLGAMACLHPHLEGIAGEAVGALDRPAGEQVKDEKNTETCSTCRRAEKECKCAH